MMPARVAASAFLLAVLGAARGAAQEPTPLTLLQAEQTALQNHPQIQEARYTALAAKEDVRAIRSAYFPTAFGSATGAEALSGSRIAAGGLNNPIIYDRFATGLAIGQLVTDFGRTQALVQSSTLTAQAQDASVESQRASALLDVDRAYFDVLRAQAVQRVAEATVEARQLVLDQVSALAAGNLRSGLDVSFARVNLSTARLLLVQAQNDTQRAFAALTSALGARAVVSYQLVEEPVPPAPPPDSAPLVSDALRQRPEILQARFSAEAALAFADAEHDLQRPSITAVGTAGVTPFRQAGIDDRFAAAGVNLNVPVLNGGLFAARYAGATMHARSAAERLRNLENQITRDVQTAWLNARTAFERLDLTSQLLDQAVQSLDLAQSRYDLGLSSIVELNQALLNKTQAELEQAAAKYDYQVQNAALGYAIGTRK